MLDDLLESQLKLFVVDIKQLALEQILVKKRQSTNYVFFVTSNKISSFTHKRYRKLDIDCQKHLFILCIASTNHYS